ncbi:hypothetical protein PInf_004011 [Phytophthora infestans]|nr:hypothetical protein PInf_004011 [Phytophthora infestans]
MRCCKLYIENPAAYTAPYVTIMQSSGFGKSRILYEVAKKIADSNTNLPESELFDCRLLYVCSNDVELSTSFPVATSILSQYFFKQPNIADRLHSAVAYACSNWEAAKTEWIELFGMNPMNDSPVSCERIDEALGTALATFMASDSTTDSPTRKKSRELLEHKDERVKVLVLAIDEAKALLLKKGKNGTNFLRLLRRALKKVNQDLATAKLKMMVFAVLTDTNSHVHDFVPPHFRETSSRNYKGQQTMLFPPYVLTHTMDIVLKQGRLQWDRPFDYKKSVLQRDPDTTWNTLISMGRPLWHSYVSNNRDDPRDVLVMAASKLLCGMCPFNKESYRESSLHGVASLMCRLGLRPQSHSAFATQVVSDFMAVLHYVNFSYDAHISGYVTEPVLTFGATHLWYEIDPLPLEEYILPQFLELLMQGLIDVGSVGEVVARIILLLAMDVTSMGEDGVRAYRLCGTRSKHFKGQFCSVKQFLDQLDGARLPEAIELYKEDGDDTKKLKKVLDTERADFYSWRDGWASWSVGFSHFIELTTVPTKATLWFLLGRRAAGVFPRNQKAADLLIPIFSYPSNIDSDARISFILIQVKNKSGVDRMYPKPALNNLTPANLFQKNEINRDTHELSKFPARDIIRIFMSLRESNRDKPAQSYLVDTEGTQGSYSLCLRGICRRPSKRSQRSLVFGHFCCLTKSQSYWIALLIHRGVNHW